VEAGVEKVPAIIRDYTDQQFLEVLTVENLQREDVHPIEEASGYAELLRGAGWTVAALASKLGKDPSYIHRRLKLLDLTDTARQVYLNGGMTLGHALVVARIPAGAQTELIETRALFDQAGGPVSLAALEKWIERQVQMDLETAPFSKADRKLVPEAGNCVDCEKRTGAAPTLWPEIQTGDRCLDRECFRRKSAAHAHEQLVKLEKAAKKGAAAPLRLSCAWHTGTEGVLAKPKWAPEDGNSCDHMRQGVVVEDGTAHPASVGNTLLVCTERSCKVHWGGLYQPPAPAPKKTDLEIATERRQTLLSRIEVITSGRIEVRKLQLAVEAQTWPPDLDTLKTLLLSQDPWYLRRASERRGHSQDEPDEAFASVIRTMDGNEVAGLLFELLVMETDDKPKIVDVVIGAGNGASMEALEDAVREEVLAEFQAELEEANKRVEQLQADAGNPASKTAKGKGRKK
jgi:ParB-like chromosome segregation protein Spo0J